MREIRFRAWIEPEARMARVDEIGLAEGWIEIQGGLQPYLFGDVKLMQYIGIKDKNGVGIFEGDIIPYAGENYAVEMCGPSWSFPEFVGIDYYGHDEPELQDWSEFEVVGNIHQNPELLGD